jgi:hypothetical protein
MRVGLRHEQRLVSHWHGIDADSRTSVVSVRASATASETAPRVAPQAVTRCQRAPTGRALGGAAVDGADRVRDGGQPDAHDHTGHRQGVAGERGAIWTGTLMRRGWLSCQRVQELVQGVLVVDVNPALGGVPVPHVEHNDRVPPSASVLVPRR